MLLLARLHANEGGLPPPELAGRRVQMLPQNPKI